MGLPITDCTHALRSEPDAGAGSTGKYRAAATFTATDTPTLFGAAVATGEALTAEEVVYITIGAAALPASGTLRVMFVYAFN